MPDPEIPSPTETPFMPDLPYEDPSGQPQEMPEPPAAPGEDGDGRPVDLA